MDRTMTSRHSHHVPWRAIATVMRNDYCRIMGTAFTFALLFAMAIGGIIYYHSLKQTD